MNEITAEDVAKYDHMKRAQTFSLLFAALLPLAPIIEHHNNYEDFMPKALDAASATESCLRDSFKQATLGEDGFHINLSAEEIDACVSEKIAQSDIAIETHKRNHENMNSQVLALSGILAAASLSVFGAASVSNYRMRKKKPGIEKVKNTHKNDIMPGL